MYNSENPPPAARSDAVLERHRYQAVNPFTSSISLHIENSRREGTINSADDVELPSSLLRPALVSSHSYPNWSASEGELQNMRGRGRDPQNFESSPYSIHRSYTAPPIRDTSFIRPSTRRRDALNVTTVHENQDEPLRTMQAEGTRIQTQSPPQSTADPVLPHLTKSTDDRRRRFGSPLCDCLMPDAHDQEKADGCPCTARPPSPIMEEISTQVYVTAFLTGIVPRQVYLHFLLRLPYMYYSRVVWIFEDADLPLEEIKHMALRDDSDEHQHGPGIPARYLKLKTSWEEFVDTVMREWKTLNIISGILISGITTIFQIDGAQSDPFTRYLAFWSLISALLSLLYGCFFIIKFSDMKRTHKAVEFIFETQRKEQRTLWNVWVMLATPALWLVWSIITYIGCIMSFMWRVRPDEPHATVLPRVGPITEAGFRIFISCILGAGAVYAALVVSTFRRYGISTDKAWRRRKLEYRLHGHKRNSRLPLDHREVPQKTQTTSSGHADESPGTSTSVPKMNIIGPSPPDHSLDVPPSPSNISLGNRSSSLSRGSLVLSVSHLRSSPETECIPNATHSQELSGGVSGLYNAGNNESNSSLSPVGGDDSGFGTIKGLASVTRDSPQSHLPVAGNRSASDTVLMRQDSPSQHLHPPSSNRDCVLKFSVPKNVCDEPHKTLS